MKKLVLFDLDGTLFDTGDVNYYAYKDALAPFGITLDKEYFVNHPSESVPPQQCSASNREITQ